MNPAGKGYGGRQKLPDNLKQLFRPVAMSRPDNDQIAEVILFSEGFKEAKSIGRKLVAVFNLSRLDAMLKTTTHLSHTHTRTHPHTCTHAHTHTHTHTTHREMLSPQQHYDWGLRALKTVLRGAGSLLETEKMETQQSKSMNFHSTIWIECTFHPQSRQRWRCESWCRL